MQLSAKGATNCTNGHRAIDVGLTEVVVAIDTALVSHPLMFDDDDPWLAQVRTICLGLPGASEKVSHGRPCYFTRKIFAIYGAVEKGDHHSGRFDHSVLVLPDPDETAALLADPRFFVPAYWGPYGWIGLDLTAAEVDWAEVGELVEDSFRMTAPAKLVAQLAG